MAAGYAGNPHCIGEILEAIHILTHSPLIGRPVRDGHRELVIGRAARGYVAMYRYVAAMDTVFVLAVRAQRGDGYRGTTAGSEKTGLFWLECYCDGCDY